MNKREFLKRLIGTEKEVSASQRNSSIVGGALDPYSGPWGTEQAAHLLRRCTFGPNCDQINQIVDLGLSPTVDMLLADKPIPEPPVYYSTNEDPHAALGETWVHKPIPDIDGIKGHRRRSLYAWMFALMAEDGISLREKMLLFWQNHFAVENISNNEYAFQFIETLRENALGDFRKLLEEVTVSPGMLTFLNGSTNTKNAPNENYARELLELFSIGRGPEAGPGDYTNYTEQDVLELARALTGWRKEVLDSGEGVSYFTEGRHDEDVKTLSARFDGVEIENAGAEEYKVVIDIILQKMETAKFICRQLHIWFVGSSIDEEVEQNVIAPLAEIFFNSNYQIKPVLNALLCSQYFYDEAHRGCMINHPIDLIFRYVNTFEVEISEELPIKMDIWKNIHSKTEDLEMAILNLPSVAGWKAFFQEPVFYSIWINNTTLPLRQELADKFINGYNRQGFRVEIDLISFIAKLENNTDPIELIKEIAKVIYCFPLSENQIEFLKEKLIPGLPDFEWTVEYSEFLADQEDEEKRLAINKKLKALFETMLKMPEFYLI